MSFYCPYDPGQPANPGAIDLYRKQPNLPINPEVWERYDTQVAESDGFDVDFFPEIQHIPQIVHPVPCGDILIRSLKEVIKVYNQRRQAVGRTSLSFVRPINVNGQLYPINFYWTFVANDDADATERTYQAKYYRAGSFINIKIFREKASTRGPSTSATVLPADESGLLGCTNDDDEMGDVEGADEDDMDICYESDA